MFAKAYVEKKREMEKITISNYLKVSIDESRKQDQPPMDLQEIFVIEGTFLWNK